MGAHAELKTERLTLRALCLDDAQAITDGISDLKVLRNLTSPPHPYALTDAEQFLGNHAGDVRKYAVWTDKLIGSVGLDDGELGYWFGVDHWGQGYATEAARAVVAHHFAHSDEPIKSGYVMDNAESRNVLLKLEFRNTDRIVKHVPARQAECEVQRMELTRADWEFACDPRIDTLRLTLRPLTKHHATALSALGNDSDVLRMLASMHLPFGTNAARYWIENTPYKGRPGFKLGIWQDETLIGALGLGGFPVSVFYWLGQDFWGQGFATEAMTGFLADMLPRMDLDGIVADCFIENAASHRVLAKLGFEKTGEGMGRSRARLEPAPTIAYRLQAENLKAS